MNPNHPAPAPTTAEATSPPIREEELWDALRGVVDPEIGLNLVDLGLIYDLRMEAGHVRVVMTVTTPGCPMVHSLTFGVETAILAVPGVEGVLVDVVYDPPWSPSMIHPDAKAAAGIV